MSPRVATSVLALLLTAGVLSAPVAVAEPGTPQAPSSSPAAPPSQEQVDAASGDAAAAAGDVASVRAALVVADQRAEQASVAAAQAAENFNGATYAEIGRAHV